MLFLSFSILVLYEEVQSKTAASANFLSDLMSFRLLNIRSTAAFENGNENRVHINLRRFGYLS